MTENEHADHDRQHADHERQNTGNGHQHTDHSESSELEQDLAALAGDAVEVDEHGLKLNLGLPDEERNAPAPLQATPEELSALAAVEAELDTRWPETKIDPSLERIEYLLDLLGNPQENFHVIHVAGTNGKSSTVRMIDSLLRGFHRRTGMFTSPHLQTVTERICLDGNPIPAREYVRQWEEIEPFVQMTDAHFDVRLSKFEILTAMAYAAFADAPVEVAVVEVGLGGTWDSTNVVNPEVSVVMPVGLDHQNYLGETIEEIAEEKAGIIKKRDDLDDVLKPSENIAIIGEQDSKAMDVILRRAVEVEAGVARYNSEFGVLETSVAVGGQQLHLRGLGGEYPEIFIPLSGSHMAANASCALAAVEAFFGARAGHGLDLDTVREGFRTVLVPGRLERVRTSPTTFIDVAHNPHGAQALGAALSRDFNFQRLIGVVAVFDDKDAKGVLLALEPHLDEVVISQNSSPRALDAYTLAEYAVEIFGEERVHTIDDLPGAYALAVELAEDAEVQSGSGIVITGSVVTAGEARTLFGKEPS